MKTPPLRIDDIEKAIGRLRTRNQELKKELEQIKTSNNNLIAQTSLNEKDSKIKMRK